MLFECTLLGALLSLFSIRPNFFSHKYASLRSTKFLLYIILDKCADMLIKKVFISLPCFLREKTLLHGLGSIYY